MDARQVAPRPSVRRRLAFLVAALVLAGGLAGVLLVQPWDNGWRGRLGRIGHALAHPRQAIAGLRGRPDLATTPLGRAERPMLVGINLSERRSGSNAPGLANLVIGSPWHVMADGWQKPPPAAVSPDGELTGRSAAGLTFTRTIFPSGTGPAGAAFRCTWRGRARVRVGGAATQAIVGPQALSFRRTVTWPDPAPVWLIVRAPAAGDPLRRLDCRRADLPAGARFEPALVEFARRFRILRFMDWQRTNVLEPVRWAGRVRPGDADTARPGGAAVEDMMALAVEAGADPWFTVPWDADDDYVRRFAGTVRDALPPGRTVYVELSNEVWNRKFAVFRRAANEGRARGLADDDRTAALLRYGERTIRVMALWRAVFAGREDRLIRVASVQHHSSAAATLLGFRDVAAHVDALSTAPYFGSVVGQPDTRDLDVWFERLGDSVDRTVRIAAGHRAAAARFGKRYIAYEAGQHVLALRDQALTDTINRDPRMGDAYRRYLGLWRAHIGDALVHYASIRRNNRNGAWGLAEYPGQPPADAPKLRAVLEAAAAR